MKIKTVLAGTTLALAGWFALASGSPLQKPDLPSNQFPSGYQVAQNEQYQSHQDRNQREDDWYQGQRGRWYQKHNEWQFGSAGLVRNDQGRDCRRGRNIPANGEGMVSRNDPNAYWACDSDGHKCHWSHRPRYQAVDKSLNSIRV